MAGEVKPIRTKKDYKAALKEVERLRGAKSGTRDGDRRDLEEIIGPRTREINE
jgi:HTH-type transcriptional regulator / antitoxin HigA